MRRKKLANKIMSILMSAMMLVSTPMSALATDVEIQQAADQVEVQTSSEDVEDLSESDDLTEENVEEFQDEDITSDEELIFDEIGGVPSDTEESEVLIGEEEEQGDPAAILNEGEMTVTTPAEDAKVSLTVSDKGVLASASDGSAVVRKEVTVTDLNSDGILTYDEALVAAHKAYNSADGYATAAYGNGVSVTKLWGVQTGSSFFYLNGKGLESNVADTEKSTVKEGDTLYAAILQDTTYYSDRYASFDADTKEVKAGEDVTLTLTADGTAAAGVPVGTWNTGSFTALEGKTTDENGQVTLSFADAGTYLVTANGTVKGMVTTDWSTGAKEEKDCPLMAPACVVTVKAAQENQKSYLSALDITPSKMKKQSLFQNGVYEYTYELIPNFSGLITFWAKLSEDAPENSKVTVTYYNIKDEKTVTKKMSYRNGQYTGFVSQAVAVGLTPVTCTISVGVEGNMQTYTVTIPRIPEIASTSLTDASGVPLTEAEGVYYVSEKQSSLLHLTLDAYGASLTVNGQTVSDKETCEITPVFDENSQKCEIKVVANNKDEKNNIEKTYIYTVKKVGPDDTVKGSCGKTATWELHGGCLTISGSGATNNWYVNSKAPWSGFSDTIEEVVIGDGITSLGNFAFYQYPELKKVTFANTVTSIGTGAFQGCSKLQQIIFGNGLNSIGDHAFENCISLKEISIPESTTSMGTEVFQGCTGLEKVETGVLGAGCFSKCNSLKEVTLRNSIKRIPESAFADCTSLERITLPDSVKTIANKAFCNCTSLKKINLPSSLTTFNGEAFENCPVLDEISVDGTQYATDGKLIYSNDKKTLILCMQNCEGEVIIPEGVTAISDGAFYDCQKITNVVLPEGLLSIGDNAFYNCVALKKMVLPDTMTELGSGAFWNCSGLQEITLSKQLETINDKVFWSCKALEQIQIPEKVNTIGMYAFDGCSNLRKIQFPEEMQSIGQYAFRACTSLQELKIPTGITELPYYMCAGDTSLEKLILPDSIKKIDNNVVSGRLESLKYVLFRGTQEQWDAVKGNTASAFSYPTLVLLRCSSLGDEKDAPVMVQQPQEQEYIVGAEAKNNLKVEMKAPENGAFYYYQWYKNTSKEMKGAWKVTGTVSEDGLTSFCTPDTEKEENAYYYCMAVKVDAGGAATWSYSDIVSVAVSKGLFEGTGSEKNPYLLKTTEDIVKLRDLVNEGNDMKTLHFKLTEDITLPENWVPIGKRKNDDSLNLDSGNNLYAFSGSLDGDNHTITVSEGEKPLLGYVYGAEVKNLNIYGTRINGYGLVDNYEGVGLEGTAIVIDHVTLKSGTQTLKSGLIGANRTVNAFAGCSAGFTATIRNCTVEEGCIIGYDRDQSMIGSIAGRMQGTVENCTSYATVYGTEYVGGIIGTRDNAMGTCSVKGCAFGGTVEASKTHAGGIVGGGYSNPTAPNGVRISINNNTCTGTITGGDIVGGILGGDSYVAQAWDYYTFKGNSFTGKVKAANGTNVGGIIGFYDSLNCWDDIAHNHFDTDCGAEKGIGAVGYVDTNCETHETDSGAIYVNTENGTSDCPRVEGCGWRKGYHRTDDPLGADADALASTGTITTYVTGLELSGTYKTEYYLLEELDLTGMIIKATYSDGNVKEIPTDAVTITGFDNTSRGEKTVTVMYEGAKTDFVVKMKKEAGKILITFQLLGDALHGEDGSVHTLADGSLTSWIPTTSYTVDENDTVYDIMKMIAKKTGFQILERASQYGTYIEGIAYNGVSLKEFDNGKNSGWMYTVNGEHPNVGVDAKYLEDGDILVFHYTDDYTREEQKDDATHTHSWDAGVVTKAPTCTEAGVRTYTCKCGETMTESIPATGHKYGEWKKSSDATVFAPEKQERTCSCGAKETRDYGSALKATIKVNATTVPLKVKQKTSAFKVTGLANGDSVQSYKSSNTKIFTVTKSGVLKAGKKTGKATLTITLASGLQKKVTVKVQKKTVATSKITGLQKKVTLKKGKKLTLKPSRTPITSTQKFTYKSSNKKIATVSSKGVIKGKKTGKAKITVKSGKKKYTVTVIVTK